MSIFLEKFQANPGSPHNGISMDCAKAIDELCTKYPTRLAAMLGALHLAQNELGYINETAMHDIATLLDVPPARVQESITFYTMFYDKPVGKHTVKVCRNLACQLRGSDKIIEFFTQTLGIKPGETTPDGKITFDVEECLAACGTAPMLWHRSYDADSKTSKEEIVENLDIEKCQTFLKLLG